MSAVDYRAEAERYAKFARELWRTDSAEAAQAATVSLAHATLAAAAKPPAPRPRHQVDSGLLDLLSAARAILAHAGRLGPDDVSIPAADLAALREQVYEATEAGL